MKKFLSLINKKFLNMYIFWIFLYLIFIIFAGVFSYLMIIDDLSVQNIQTTNMFKTILHQNSLQLISNPDAFQRVVVSDSEGQVLVQYGSLIPGLDLLNTNPIFEKIKTENYAISSFYFDPVLNKLCFDLGLQNKNRIFIGTITLDESINKFLGNVDLTEFIVLDRNNYGYLFSNDNFLPINKNNNQTIHWINSTILKYDNCFYYYVGRNVEEMQFISFEPVIENILFLFILFLIPFFFGLGFIYLIKKMLISTQEDKAEDINSIYHTIHSGRPVPENFLDEASELNGILYQEINNLLEKNDLYQLESMRFSKKLGNYSEYINGLKMNLEYVQRYFEEAQLKNKIHLEESLVEIFSIFFSENDSTAYAVLSINEKEFFSCGEKTEKTYEISDQIIELGSYTVKMKIAFKEKDFYDLKQLEIQLFNVFVKYLLYINIIKNNEYTNEFNSARNFKLFSDLVSKEIHKANRYNLKGILAYFALKNKDELIHRYGTEIFQMINDSMSAVIRSEIRKSDIIGTYKDGFFLVYFYNIDSKIVDEKIDQMVEKILIEEKIKQLDINIQFKTGYSEVENNTKNFDTVFGKLLIEEDNEG